MDSLDQQQLKLALSLTEIIHKIDIIEAASILASFDWNINVDHSYSESSRNDRSLKFSCREGNIEHKKIEK